MKYIHWYLCFCFFMFMNCIKASPSFEALDHLLSDFKSMKANFEQTTIIKKNVAKKSSGTMALQRPGKFRWEITQPNHQIILADGKYLWIYDIDLEQATKQSLSKDSNSPATLLSGSIHALNDRFTLIDSRVQQNKKFFKLVPKHKQDMISEIELGFVDDKLHQMTVSDNLGQKNIFYFSNVKVNVPLANQLFIFHAPKGVDIVNQ